MSKYQLKTLITLDFVILGLSMLNIILWFATLDKNNTEKKHGEDEFTNYKNIFIPLFITFLIMILMIIQKKASNYQHKMIFIIEKLTALILTFIAFSMLLRIILLMKNVTSYFKVFIAFPILTSALFGVSMFLEMFIRQKNFNFRIGESSLFEKRSESRTENLFSDLKSE